MQQKKQTCVLKHVKMVTHDKRYKTQVTKTQFSWEIIFFLRNITRGVIIQTPELGT